MFYHDHSWGITRLGVYVGEAAPYIVHDATEDELLSADLIPGAANTIPLVIQDKTFVNADQQVLPIFSIPTQPGYGEANRELCTPWDPTSLLLRCWTRYR